MCSKAEVNLFSDASRVVAGFFRVAQSMYMDSVEMVTGSAMFGPLSISCHVTPSGRSKGYTRHRENKSKYESPTRLIPFVRSNRDSLLIPVLDISIK